MKKQKLNFRFHNPNTAEETANYMVKIFIEANEKKVEQAIRLATEALPDMEQEAEGSPA